MLCRYTTELHKQDIEWLCMIRLATRVGSRGNKVIKAGGGINGDKTKALALMSIVGNSVCTTHTWGLRLLGVETINVTRRVRNSNASLCWPWCHTSCMRMHVLKATNYSFRLLHDKNIQRKLHSHRSSGTRSLAKATLNEDFNGRYSRHQYKSIQRSHAPLRILTKYLNNSEQNSFLRK